MPGITEEWKYKLSENEIKYKMKIHSFDHKMRTWRCGREVYSKIFVIGDSKFQLSVLPNGETKEDKGHVSVFLRNKNSWNVKVNYKIDLGLGSSVIKIIESRDDLIEGFHAKEWKKFASHDDLMNVDVIDDGKITVTASITLLCEEVVADGISSKI